MTAFRKQRNFALEAADKADARAALVGLEGTGLTLAQAVEIAKRVGGRISSRATVREVADKFVASRTEHRPATVLWYENKLTPVLTVFGNFSMDDVKREQLAQAIDGLPVGESTKCSHRRACRALWRWAKAQTPPMAGADITEGMKVTPKHLNTEGAEFLPVDDVARILTGISAKHRPAAALLFFAGVRPQELWGNGKPPMLWGAIDVQERTVRVDAKCAKTRRARVLEGLPDALWAWIGQPGADAAPICPGQSQQLIRAMQQAGGFWRFVDKGRGRKRETLRQWPHDATRHTFATYTLNFYDNPGLVAGWLGHEGSTKMLHAHYKGITRKAEAEKFLALRPK